MLNSNKTVVIRNVGKQRVGDKESMLKKSDAEFKQNCSLEASSSVLVEAFDM